MLALKYIALHRPIYFKALDNKGNSITYQALASCTSYGGGIGRAELNVFIGEKMDELLLDHLKANPKK